MALKYLDLTGVNTLKTLLESEMDSKDSTSLQSAKDYADSLAVNYDAAGTAATKASEALESAKSYTDDSVSTLKDDLESEIGTLENLSTTAKSDLVNSINEVYAAVGSGGTNAVVGISTATTTEGYAKSYTITQGGSTIGVIDIPKDMVVSSGTVEVDPTGMDAGTYLVLTLANADSDTIYINVGDLVDTYTAAASATQVQLSITNNVISATIVAGGVGTTELADSAVTTAKIADGNVTKAKLSTAVQASLDLADSAVQSVTTGTANGTISVDGTNVNVYGLGSAAYTDSSAYDASGAAAAVLGSATDTASTYTVYGAFAYAASVATEATEAITEAEIQALFA